MIPVDDVPCMCAFHVWFDFESCCFKSLTPSPLIDGEVVYFNGNTGNRLTESPKETHITNPLPKDT